MPVCLATIHPPVFFPLHTPAPPSQTFFPTPSLPFFRFSRSGEFHRLWCKSAALSAAITECELPCPQRDSPTSRRKREAPQRSEYPRLPRRQRPAPPPTATLAECTARTSHAGVG